MTEPDKQQEKSTIDEEKYPSESSDVFQNALEYLIPLKDEKLKEWIYDFLFYCETLNISIPPKGTSPSLVFVGIYKRASRGLKKRIEESIRELIVEWDVDSGSTEFFFELLVLVAELRLISVYNVLLEYAKKEGGLLKGKKAYGIDLHLVLLRTLVSFPTDADIEMIAKRDINHHFYTELAFEKLWQSKDGFSKGINNLRILFEVYDEHPEIDIEFALEGFFLALGPGNFCELLQEMLDSVGLKYQKMFLITCRDVGVRISNLNIKKGWESEREISFRRERRVLVNIDWEVYSCEKNLNLKRPIDITLPIIEFLQEEGGGGFSGQESDKENDFSRNEKGAESTNELIFEAERRFADASCVQ